MKYAIVIPDGASDEPFEALGGLTALQAAAIPNMDRIARDGVLGRSKNVPDRFKPASDVATLSLFGYDPERYYSGRSPLEVAAMGLELGPHDWAVRCNLVYVEDGRMTDFTAGHVTSEEAADLIEAIKAVLENIQPGVEFHPGVSYRNAMVYRGGPKDNPFGPDLKTTPPHDVPDEPVAAHLPSGTGSRVLLDLMSAAAPILAEHPANRARVAAGKRPANGIWLWGEGQSRRVPSFFDLHGVRGAIISAVDLVRGVGQMAGWDRIDVPGATGYLDTDYAAKGRYAVAALADYDLVCVHVEAPDEASHEGRADAKVEALERIDRDIVGPLLEALPRHGDWRVLVSPDHSTLLRTRAHDRAPVAWAMAGTGLSGGGHAYDEASALKSGGPLCDPGWGLMARFLGG
jgi:2,3-bisphosphoglycerate-independent phosphoglycerate mutase